MKSSPFRYLGTLLLLLSVAACDDASPRQLADATDTRPPHNDVALDAPTPDANDVRDPDGSSDQVTLDISPGDAEHDAPDAQDAPPDVSDTRVAADGDAPDAADDVEADTEADQPDPPTYRPGFVYRDGVQLMADGALYRRIGVNKFDLFFQFLGIASGDAGVAVTRPMALKALDDAAAAGFHLIRVAGVGYWPHNMETYLNDEPAYWAAFDDMVAEAASRDIKLVPVVWWHLFLFADMAGEPLGQTFTPGSASHTALLDYTRKLVSRYKDEPTIAFWELTNEINLEADLDFARRTNASICLPCGTPAARSAADNFSTDAMVATMAAMAQVIRQEAPDHLISAGYSIPRSAAWHLRASPEWGGADWTRDSEAELRSYVALTHPDPIDLVSVHLYNTGDGNARFGITGTCNPDIIVPLQEAADAINKPLYIGEFGDAEALVGDVPESNFTRRVAWAVVERRVPVTTHWVWEFYQFAPDQAAPFSIEPGINDDLIAVMGRAGQLLSSAPAQRSMRLPVREPSFESDSDGDGLVDGWETVWRVGSSTNW